VDPPGPLLARGDHAAERANPGVGLPDVLAKNIVRWNLRDLETGFKGGIGALVQAGNFGTKVIGMVDGTALESTEHYAGCGQATRKVRIGGIGGARCMSLK
jgi:hypothetical protein